MKLSNYIPPTKHHRCKKGFTLIEMLVVIGVLAALTAICLPTLSGLIDRAKRQADVTNAKTLYTTTMAALSCPYDDTASHYNNPQHEYQIVPAKSFYQHNTSIVHVTDGNGSSYNFVTVVSVNCSGRQNTYGGNSEANAFRNVLLDSLGNKSFKVSYQNQPKGGNFATYFIGYRQDKKDQIEVWVGPNGWQNPKCKLYPLDGQDPAYK